MFNSRSIEMFGNFRKCRLSGRKHPKKVDEMFGKCRKYLETVENVPELLIIGENCRKCLETV